METKKRVDKAEKVMPEYNEGTLKSGKGAEKVTRQQAVIIRLNAVGLRIKSKE